MDLTPTQPTVQTPDKGETPHVPPTKDRKAIRVPFLDADLGEYAIDAVSDGSAKVTWTRRDGQPGVPMAGGVIRLEKHSDLASMWARGRGGDPGVYWGLQNLPQVQAAINRPVRTLAATPVRWERPELPEWASEVDRTEAEIQFEWAQKATRWTPAQWAQFARESLKTTVVTGFCPFELVGEEREFSVGGVDGKWICPLPPEWRAPWSVRYWLTLREDLQGVVFDFYQSSDYQGHHGESLVAIPAEKLLLVTSERVGSNWEGYSWLRPIYNHLLMLRQAYQLQALAVEVHGVGELFFLMSEDSPGNPNDVAALKAYLGSRKAESAPGAILPHGITPMWSSPDSNIPDLTPVFESLERAIAIALDSDDRLIALQQAGSFAARETASADARDSYDYIFQSFIAHPLEEMLRRFIRLNFPGHDRVWCPRLAYGQVEERDMGAYVETVSKAYLTGLLDDPVIGPPLREQLDLPPLPEDTSAEDVEGFTPEPIASSAPAQDTEANALSDLSDAIQNARLAGLLTTIETIEWARNALGMPPMTPEERVTIKRQLEGMTQDTSTAPEPDPLPSPEPTP